MSRNSLTNLIKEGAVLVDVDTSAPTVVMFFRTKDGNEHRVEMWPERHEAFHADESDTLVVEWSVESFNIV